MHEKNKLSIFETLNVVKKFSTVSKEEQLVNIRLKSSAFLESALPKLTYFNLVHPFNKLLRFVT